jgi:hypothetical protein
MTPWPLLLALAATPVAVPADAPAPAPEPAPTADALPAPTPAASEAFLTDVVIACPAGATRTTFPLVPNTLFEVETLDAVSSKFSHPGDTFRLRLREPLRYGAVELVPAGTPVHGEVTHASQNKWGGTAGELILATRYVQLPQGRLRLRSSIAASGRNRNDASATVTILFGIAGVFIQGKNKELPIGTQLSARLAEPVTFRCADAPAPAPVPATPAPETHQ